MQLVSPTLINAGLRALHVSGIANLGASRFRGLGAILCLHQVLPDGGQNAGFAPNYQLELDTQFLDQLLQSLSSDGFRFVSLDAAIDEIQCGKKQDTPFLSITLDDGYRDNMVHAAPIFRRHHCPYAIFVVPQIADGTCELWWKLLELLIARTDRLSVTLQDKKITFEHRAPGEKTRSYSQVFFHLKNMDEYDQRKWVRKICIEHGIDADAECRNLGMSWDELRTISHDPLCTIGAHTLNHYALKKLQDEDCRRELASSRRRIQEELKIDARHFAYPYGDYAAAGPRDFALAAAAGFRSAVTTRKGMLFPEHSSHLHALPRVMISGRYQSVGAVRTLLTGTPFALSNRFRRLNVC